MAKLPPEFEMRSLEKAFLDSITLTAGQISMLQSIGEYREKRDGLVRQASAVLESLEWTAFVESSESSNRLEGITAPRERIAELARKTITPRGRSESEIAGYMEALRLIHESWEHMDFTINVIMQLHSMMNRYLPAGGGRWKHVDNEIVERNPDGSIKRVRFKPVSALQTPQAMDYLVHEYREAIDVQRMEPLVVIPCAIFDFLAIHPFIDGNGRMSRLLTVLLLCQFDFDIGRYVSLERVMEESAKQYYAALERTSPGWHEGRHDIGPWIDYMWSVLIRAYEEFERRVKI